jgi:tetratricopeptide (TPR) repeat protein
MLFDLRGRGRRRTIQVIYLSLAILMGGGLVLFGIGGNTSGGLVDAIQGNSGGTDADEAFNKRVETLEKRTRTNPQDARAWAQLASLRFQAATTGENYDNNTQSYTTKGKAELRRATAAWQRHLALEPDKPDATVANQMVQAYGVSGLQQYDEAVRAMEVVIDNRDPTYQIYAQLSVLAHAAKQDRKSTLAADKAVELAPRAERKDVREQIKLAKTQLDNVAQAGTPEPQQ